MPNAELIARRERLLGPANPLFYDDPVHLVRGEGVWLYDADGRRYLDCYNNVPHVGHCHPHVVEAIARQASTLNTHTRYLDETILDYAERLIGTFDDPLSTAIFACTGSEANEIALRMAHVVTGATGLIATSHAYHGNTTAVSQLSTIMPPVEGLGRHVRTIPPPDSYRPLRDLKGDKLASAYAYEVERAIDSLEADGLKLSAILVCPFFANEGFPDVPAGFMEQAIERVREAGGLYIADEVQPGFGRTGSHMWGYMAHRIVPDIVTMGKPMGNGHPLSGVVARADLVSEFREKVKYFNTFGGNAVSCAAGMAVLDVVEKENLMENARVVGDYAKEGLHRLQEKHDLIGDVRGRGLFFGAELVRDRAAKDPASEETKRIVNAMRAKSVLLSKIGPHDSILKMRPPMPFSKENADQLLSTLDDVLCKV